MALKRYSSKETQIFIWVMGPYILILNLLVFGTCIFNSFSHFIVNFFFSAIYICLIYFVFGLVALFIRNRIPAAGSLVQTHPGNVTRFLPDECSRHSWIVFFL